MGKEKVKEKVEEAAPPPAAPVEEVPSGPPPPPPPPLRKFFVGGNWKCNGTRASFAPLIADLNKSGTPVDYIDKRKRKQTIPARIDKKLCEIVVAPTFVYIPEVVKTLIQDVYAVAGQNCWTNRGGAFTGETSADQLVDVGCKWVILGHSERRSLLSETDAMIGTKAAYAISAGLSVIACIGEAIHARKSGKTNEVCFGQLQAYLNEVKDVELWRRIVVAYEPVWAIGTGKAATPEVVQEVHSALRGWLVQNVTPEVAEHVRIVYGGSVNAANCKPIAKMEDVDGFLVGGAALNGEDFTVICLACTAKTEVEEVEEEVEDDENQDGDEVAAAA